MRIINAVIILLISIVFILLMKRSIEGLKTFDDIHPRLNTKLQRKELKKSIRKKTKIN